MLSEFQLGRRGINTGTTTTTITDVLNFSGPTAAEGIEVGSEVLITSGTGAPADEFARLNSKPLRTTGVMTLDRTLTAALENGDTFEVLYPGISFDSGPNSIHQALNDALADFPFEKRQVPITLVTNGDMLALTASATPNWTASSSTLTLAAAAFPAAERMLVVVATSADGQAQSVSVGIEAGESYYLEATGFVSTAGAATEGTLVLYDVTNAASISLTDTDITTGDPTILVNSSVTMPSGSLLVQVRPQTDTNAGVTGWTDIIFRKNSAREFTIKDRPVRILRLGRLLATRLDTWGVRGSGWDDIPAEPVQLDSGLWQYHADVDLSGKSVWYEEYVEPVAFSSDSSTTTINKRELAAIAAERVLRPLARSKIWRDRYAFAASAAATARLSFNSLRTVLDQRTRTYPVARV
ncbi:hypothetical protein LCGC14_1929860 [marine sediment metagenome]|uniref:Uncharacterized protein n=1 Tax=marine sediment metagenome TaxID=412755 RepID=A0A0F9FND1_9ZZZZ